MLALYSLSVYKTNKCKS